jgi:hypothetical protein
MARRKFPPGTQCVHCRQAEATTDDHVPPKNLFPKGTTGLIEVPACRECNGGDSSDDDYFRKSLVLRKGVADKPETKEVLEATLRGLNRKDYPGMLIETIKGSGLAARRYGQLYLGSVRTYDVDPARMNRVATRVVQGLYWKETGAALPQGYVALAYGLDGFDEFNITAMAALQRLAEGAQESGLRVVGDGVFEYTFGMLPREPAVSVWILRFLGEVYFFGCTAAEGSVARSL